MFDFVRTIYWYVMLVMLTFFFGVLQHVNLIIFCANRERRRHLSLWYSNLWSRMLISITGSKVQVAGLENYDANKSYIIVANHQSYFDIFSLLGYFCIDYSFISKKLFAYFPLLGTGMKEAGFLFIDRNNSRQALSTLKEAAEKIRKGTSIIIFPEGTRSVDGAITSFKMGFLTLAAMCQEVDILPITIVGSKNIQSKDDITIHKANVTLLIDKPIRYKGSDIVSTQQKRAIIKKLENIIKKNYQRCLSTN